VTTRSLLPQAFWFRMAAVCLRMDNIPKSKDSGGLLDLPELCIVPNLSQLDRRVAWAEVRAGWNPGGLGIAVVAQGFSDQQLVRHRPEGFAVAQFWIDTRDTRTVSRATRFCHRFVIRLEPTEARRGLRVIANQRPIARAVADAPLCPPLLISSRAELRRDEWLLEVFLPAQALHGFDPETNRRLGFAYQITDHMREDQFLGIGGDFPVGENPSLWSTLELHD
jgi:hypothetical protein